jgi:hypothetical protein
MPDTTDAKPATTRRTGKTAAQEKAQEAAQANAKAPETVWERLAAPFPQEDLERLPKALSREDRNKGRCEDTDRGRQFSADGYYCGGWHVRSVHLTYVGHAGITTRLNQVLTPAGWDFGPLVSHPQSGLPFMERGEFWGTLTIEDPETGNRVSKTDLAANYNSTQEAWGDALRRCAMRFGVGTYLWSKSEAAHAQAQYAEPMPEPEPQQRQPEPQAPAPQADPAPWVPLLEGRLHALDADATAEVRDWWGTQGLPPLKDLDQWQAAAVNSYLDEREQGAPADPSEAR